MKKLIPLLAILVLACSCDGDIKGEYTPSSLVVEGYIDNDSTPVVYLTRTIDVLHEYHRMSRIEKSYVVRDAQVYVNGIQLERKDSTDNYLHTCYTTEQVKGVIGEDYQLMIVWHNDTCVGKASITGPVAEAVVTSTPVSGENGKFKIAAKVKRIGKGQYGRIFVKTASVAGQEYLLAPNTGFKYDDFGQADSILISVLNPSTDYLEDDDKYFLSGQTVHIKVAMMDSASYYMWNDFEKHTDLSKNPLFPVNGNMTGTMDGAVGYWTGYASAFYEIQI